MDAAQADAFLTKHLRTGAACPFYLMPQLVKKSNVSSFKIIHFEMRVFCRVPIRLVRLLFWRSVPFVETFASLGHEICLFSKKRFVSS